MARHILITGASSGIGAAIARILDRPENTLSLGARRVARLAKCCPRAFHARLDVTDQSSIDAFLAAARDANGPVDVLVNNAGLARGLETVAEATGEAWREMIETNVIGLLNVTRRVLPEMLERGTGHVIMIGSIAGHQTYERGSVYCATKFAVRAIARTIRQEVHGTDLRVSSIDPGLVNTEFSLVRFAGDAERARRPYQDTRPLSADDVAECVAFAVSRPPHVNIEEMIVLATDQCGPTRIHRHGGT